MNYIPDVAEQPANPRTLPVLRVVGQVGATYIVSEGPAGLYLVDQNAAHERVLYEEICADLAAGELARLAQEESQTVMLSPQDAELLENVGSLFESLGFEIEVFGPSAFVVRALPKYARNVPVADLLPRMLDYLRATKREIQDGVAALAFAAALRRGQVLPELRICGRSYPNWNVAPIPCHRRAGVECLFT